MSPASQGNLEVERYIGSCLISARTNNNSNKNAGVGSHGQQHYKNKKVTNGDIGGGNPSQQQQPPRGGRLQSRPLLGCPHHHHHGFTVPPGAMVPMCECARYGTPGHNAPGGGWAGMPLISMATNARRNRKPAAASNGAAARSNAKQTPAQRNGTDGDPNLRTPLSRLAIHTQGAPLILAGHFNARKNNNNNNNVHRGPTRQFKADLPGRRCNVDVPSRDLRGSGNNNTPNSDCLSVASDESSGHSENSLPRIIKPRKRRKKDRKPPASPTTGANSTAEPDTGAELTGIVTLKPYVPLCHELYDSHRGGRRREEVDTKWVSDQPRACAVTSSKKCADEDAKQVKPPVEDHSEEDGPQNTLFPYPCPPSTCQCRYCDPAGQIWDVDQHCYSPFLTPPSLDLSYSESSLVHIPLFLTPPAEARTFDLFNKDFKDSSSSVSDTDHKEVVRRSWSEPSGALYSDNEDTRGALNDFGVIGGGRSCEGARATRKDAPRHLSTSSESSTHSSISPSLVVSTEIVTSLNGHRDIEIKFFSSSPPSVMVDLIGGCENSDTSWGSSEVSQQELWGSSQSDVSVFNDDLKHNLMSVWGRSDKDEEGGDPGGDGTWGTSWPLRQRATPEDPSAQYDSSSKILSDEVNQLCLQNVEE